MESRGFKPETIYNNNKAAGYVKYGNKSKVIIHDGFSNNRGMHPKLPKDKNSIVSVIVFDKDNKAVMSTSIPFNLILDGSIYFLLW